MSTWVVVLEARVTPDGSVDVREPDAVRPCLDRHWNALWEALSVLATAASVDTAMRLARPLPLVGPNALTHSPFTEIGKE